MKRKFYEIKPSTMKRDFGWNLAGNLLFAAQTVILLAVVSRLCGVDTAGIFSLAYSIAQMMFMIACFEMANVLITDSRRKIGFWESLRFRMGSNALMLVCAGIFAWFQGFSGLKLQVFACLVVYMSLLSFAEFCESHMHRSGYLYLSGRSLACDTFLCSLVFGLVLFVSRNLLLAVLSMCAVTLTWILVYDIPFLHGVGADRKTGENFDWHTIRLLLGFCLPLVCMRFILSYIINSPKLAIDSYLTLRDQSFYGYMLMPAACINLLSLFLLRPQLANIAKFYNSGDDRAFVRVVLLLVLWNGLVTAAVLLGGWFLGIPILSLFYGVDLSGNELILTVALTGGCFYSFATLFDAVATAMRVHRWNLLVYIPAFFGAMTLTYSLVRRSGLMGAALSYMFLMLFLAAGSGLILLIFYIRHLKQTGKLPR